MSKAQNTEKEFSCNADIQVEDPDARTKLQAKSQQPEAPQKANDNPTFSSHLDTQSQNTTSLEPAKTSNEKKLFDNNQLVTSTKAGDDQLKLKRKFDAYDRESASIPPVAKNGIIILPEHIEAMMKDKEDVQSANAKSKAEILYPSLFKNAENRKTSETNLSLDDEIATKPAEWFANPGRRNVDEPRVKRRKCYRCGFKL